MFRRSKSFEKDEDGAVSVDWVVLTAAIGALGSIVVLTIAQGATDTSSGLGAHLGNMTVYSYTP